MTEVAAGKARCFGNCVSNLVWGVLFLKKIETTSQQALFVREKKLILNKMPSHFWIAYSYYLPNVNMGYQKSELKVEHSSQDQCQLM